jgi:hypothetical protein
MRCIQILLCRQPRDPVKRHQLCLPIDISRIGNSAPPAEGRALDNARGATLVRRLSDAKHPTVIAGCRHTR